jgi:hypothetical protein
MPQARERARTLSRPCLAGRQEKEADRKAPFDHSTLVCRDELAEYLAVEPADLKTLIVAGVLPRNPDGQFPLVRCIQRYIRLCEMRSVHALAAREERAGPRKVA